MTYTKRLVNSTYTSEKGLKSGPVRNTPSPTPSCSSTSSSSSSKSTRFSDSDDSATIGLNHQRYSPAPSTCHVKSALKKREFTNATPESEYGKVAHIVVALGTLDNILKELVTCVKSFKCPSELDFSAASDENPLALANVEKNRPFIAQLQKLNQFRGRWRAVLTYDDEKLKQKHKAVGMAIEGAREQMKKRQLKLYNEFTVAVESALDDLTIDLNIWVKAFVYPSKLDFVPSSKGLVLYSTKRNQPFIDQLRKLDWFRGALKAIPKHNNEDLKNKRAIIRLAIHRNIENMREHQAKLYRRQSRM